MATEIYMVEGDTAPDRTFNITRSGAAVDLSSATVKLVIVDTGTGLVTNGGHQECDINSPATAGIVTYLFDDGDIASPNVHFGDIVATYGSGQVETDFDRILIHVRPKVTTVS
mgnify:CR=1 FL=1